MNRTVIKIATRQSPLALWQAHHIRDQLRQRYPDIAVELVTFVTQGDRILDAPLAKIGGKGLFVKELENALLDGRADLAVHSMKDVPRDLPAGLCLPVIGLREDPHDAFVSNHFENVEALPQGATVGTSSLRRRCQLQHYRPDLRIEDLRGNVGTRLGKLDQGQYDAIILACAGLHRLGLSERIRQTLPVSLSLPAVGQGALGLECRQDDTALQNLLAPLNDFTTSTCVRAERAFNHTLMGGCQAPIAAYAVIEAAQIWLRGRVGEVETGQLIQGEKRGLLEHAELLGQSLAQELLDAGADRMLAHLR